MVIVGVGLVVGLVLFVCFGSSVSIFSGLHDRADRLEADPPAGLSLVDRFDRGSMFCPFECGGAWTALVYSAPGLDQTQLCLVGASKLTDLFGQPSRGRAQPAGCVQDGSGESWPLPGVYRDNASASLKIEPAEKYHVSGGGSVLVVVLDSGRA